MASVNTTKRLTSAAVMISFFALILWWGQLPSLVLVGLVGILLHDEIFVNFLQRKRDSSEYLFSGLLLVLPYVLVNYYVYLFGLWWPAVFFAVFLNILLVLYVFYVDINSKILLFFRKNFSFIAGPFVLFSIISVSILLHHEEWRKLVIVLFVLNVAVDTGGWLVGKHLGKHKLWPSVSPKKTVEGLLGGVLLSVIVTTTLWWQLFTSPSMSLVIFFIVLSFLSQLGDLIQSKIKRQFNLKDSSDLIPGHGGVYDRLDAVLFTAPFFACAMYYFLNGSVA